MNRQTIKHYRIESVVFLYFEQGKVQKCIYHNRVRRTYTKMLMLKSFK